MGISDLYSVLREQCPWVIQEAHLSEFSGKKFAIDISIFLHKFIRTSFDDQWMNSFILMLCTFKKHNIKAICIFDGPNPPEEKKEEQLSRRQNVEKVKFRLQAAKKLLSKINASMQEYLTLPEEFGLEAKTILNRGRNLDTTDYTSVPSVIESLQILIERLTKQTRTITDKHRTTAQRIVKILGLACLEAEGEAEMLCAYLVIKGLADAVLTEDTDVMAYGTPVFVALKEHKLLDQKVQYIHLPSVLESLGYTFDQFQDLCIFLGCDYNKRAKWYPPDGKKRKNPVSIGAKRAVEIIDTYGSYEAVKSYITNSEEFKHDRCKQLFEIPNFIPFALIPFSKPIQEQEYLSLCEEFPGITIKLDEILKRWESKTQIVVDET